MPRTQRSGRYRKYSLGTRTLLPLKVRNPSRQQIRTLKIVQHVWTVGDKYSKLAAEYYNDSTLWWVIARYNMKPTDAHVRVGDNIRIPLPLEQILKIYGV